MVTLELRAGAVSLRYRLSQPASYREMADRRPDPALRARREAFLAPACLPKQHKRLGVEPYAYLHDILRRLPSHPNKDIWQLTPRGWKETFAPKNPPPSPSG